MDYNEFKTEQERRERLFVRNALVQYDWNPRRAAESIGVPRSTIRWMLLRLGLADEYQANNPGRGRPKKTEKK